MWKALTIDMGWTQAEWLRSVTPQKPPTLPEVLNMELGDYLWDPKTPPTWATPYRKLLTVTENGKSVEAEPTVRNVLLHTLRHAAAGVPTPPLDPGTDA
jgi:hypothetical protein